MFEMFEDNKIARNIFVIFVFLFVFVTAVVINLSWKDIQKAKGQIKQLAIK